MCSSKNLIIKSFRSLPLFGAGVSFGNTDENEFIIK